MKLLVAAMWPPDPSEEALPVTAWGSPASCAEVAKWTSQTLCDHLLSKVAMATSPANAYDCSVGRSAFASTASAAGAALWTRQAWNPSQAEVLCVGAGGGPGAAVLQAAAAVRGRGRPAGRRHARGPRAGLLRGALRAALPAAVHLPQEERQQKGDPPASRCLHQADATYPTSLCTPWCCNDIMVVCGAWCALSYVQVQCPQDLMADMNLGVLGCR